MYTKHQTSCVGDMSFMEKLLPKEIKVQHIDSYNREGKIRFQGAFYYEFTPGIFSTCHEAPLEILKIAKSYRIYICTTCMKNPHLTWTIWFYEV